MLMHVDHLVPGMELEHDVKLKAGGLLITMSELTGGKLDEQMIASIRRFSGQLAPVSERVNIKASEEIYTHVRKILAEDISSITSNIEAGGEYPNYFEDIDLREKVLRVMDKLTTNPDIIRSMYEFKIGAGDRDPLLSQLLDHSIRTTMLVIAVGLKLRWSIISLVNVGMAAILHDMGIIRTEIYPNLKKLDDMIPQELEEYITEHQDHSAEIFCDQKLNMLQFTKNEIEHIIRNHHRPDINDTRHKTTLLLFFAELVDEMISSMPHKVRYNFTRPQVKSVGEKFSRRNGLVNVMLALIKLYKNNGLCWNIVNGFVDVFSLQELLVDGYEDKLKEIIDICPYHCAVSYPHPGGCSLPRTIYCNNSNEEGFSCDYMGQVRIEIFIGPQKSKSFNKCATLTSKLSVLNKAGREDQDLKSRDDQEEAKEEEKAVQVAENGKTGVAAGEAADSEAKEQLTEEQLAEQVSADLAAGKITIEEATEMLKFDKETES